MKKFLSLLLVMMGFLPQLMQADVLLTPDPAKTYLITHSSGLVFTADGNTAKIMQPGNGVQNVTFIPVEGEEGVYNIKMSDGRYFGSDSGYTVKFPSEASDDYTKFTFLPHGTEEGYLKMRNVGRNAFIGTDNNSDGGGVYTDKNGNDGKHAWVFVEASEGLLTASLENAIANAGSLLEKWRDTDAITAEGVQAVESEIDKASNLLASATTQQQINEGTTALSDYMNAASALYNAISSAQSRISGAETGDVIGGYEQADVDIFNNAVESAKARWADGTIEAFNEGAADLNSAADTFMQQRNVFIAHAGKKYYFVNTYTNFLLGMDSKGEAVLAAPTGEDTQLFEIIPLEGSKVAFNIKRADGEGYLATRSGWNSQTLQDPNDDLAKIWLAFQDFDNLVYTLNRPNYNGAWACDDNNIGSTVYTNKSQGQYNAGWRIIEFNEGDVMRFGLDDAIATAENHLATAKVGDNPGEYPQSAVDALAAVLAEVKGKQYTTQAEVNEACEMLYNAIAAFLSEKINPFFVPEPGTAYRFSVRKYAANYMCTGEEKVTTSAYEAGNTTQHWTFEPVEGPQYTYVVKNGDMVLNNDGTLIEYSAENPSWSVVYTGTFDNLPYFALVDSEDSSKVVTFGSGKNFTIQTLDASNNAHQARFQRVDMPNDPDVLSLEKAVASARHTLETVDRGNEIGKYSEAKCAAFEAIVDEIDALRGLTQDEVDTKVTELGEAHTAFLANKNSVVKDELDSALAEARLKAEAAYGNIGIEIGQYMPSAIEAFVTQINALDEAGKAISEQEACDALAAEVIAATEAFTGHTEVQAVATVLDDVIAWCKALYEAEKDNVGDGKDERPQSVIDAFKAAIDKAKGIEAPEVSDITALLDARQAFLSGAISQDRTQLRKAIAEAEGEEFSNLVAGEFDGCYPQGKIDAFRAALAEAKAHEADMSKTQEEIDAAAKSLTDAMNDLRKARVSVSFAQLDKALADARAAIAGVTIIGDGAGECPRSAVEALQAKLTEADSMDRAAVTQAQVDSMTGELAEANATFHTVLVASSGINEWLDDAKAMIDSATEGFKPGNYPAAAIAGLNDAVERAMLAALDNESTQGALLAAVADLKEAVEYFKSQVIPSHDLTSIQEAIAEAEELIASTGYEDFILNTALEAARQIVANPDNYTKSQVTKAENDLRIAIEYARETLGTHELPASALAVQMSDGAVTVSGISTPTTVAIHALDGALVAKAEVCETTRFELAAGSYIVVAVNHAAQARKTVIVK